jgi:hypothetical protein
VFSLGTVNSSNESLKRVYIRPTQPWSPHYEEDTDFKACAPASSPFIDPPLHFAIEPTTQNVNWCAEVYPTQNPYLINLEASEPVNSGKVINYTSHVVKAAQGSACTATTASNTINFPANYPANGAANHNSVATWDKTAKISSGGNACLGSGTSGSECTYKNSQTCDRTVLDTGTAWEKFPLLANAADTESAISQDSTFGCIVTYDGGGGKAGKKSPGGGCCGTAVKIHGANSVEGPKSAHLEPSTEQTTQCKTPSY